MVNTMAAGDLSFRRIDGPFPSIVVWATKRGAASYVVTFDKKAPEMGWRASWATDENSIIYLPSGFKSKRAAINALRQIMN